MRINKHPTKTRRAPKKPKKQVRGECTIPPRVPDTVLEHFTLGRNEHEADAIRDYVEWQCAKDHAHVTYLEKVNTEHVFGIPYACWNVRTEKERYWVITNPTNLYSQELFPSLDYTLSFHIGLMARVQAERKGSKDDRVGDRLATAFRRWEQAAAALDKSSESEEIQAVGMRCRECLVTLVRAAATTATVPDGQEPPAQWDWQSKDEPGPGYWTGQGSLPAALPPWSSSVSSATSCCPHGWVRWFGRTWSLDANRLPSAARWVRSRWRGSWTQQHSR